MTIGPPDHGWVVNIQREADTLRAQRDALLEALEEAEADLLEWFGSYGGGRKHPETKRVLQTIKSAIAKARGQS